MLKTTLLKKKTVAENTMMFEFDKPDDFIYHAGQSIDLTLINPPETDTEGNTRAFSLTSAPHEETLTITTRMRDTAFKRTLKSLPEGTEINLLGPFGSFMLHENTERPGLFLVGGIGITPFYSMIKDWLEKKLPHKLFLFYSNRKPEDTAFLNELTKIKNENKKFTFIPTMTNIKESKVAWSGEEGYIDEKMLKKYGSDTITNKNPIYYSAGPANMVSAMRVLLNKMNISNDEVRTEEFSGYK